ncbi:MAG: hypothetical protein AB1478_11610 [Nitrospirota bacterium]
MPEETCKGCNYCDNPESYHIGIGGRCLFYEQVNCLSTSGEFDCEKCYFYPKERKLKDENL